MADPIDIPACEHAQPGLVQPVDLTNDQQAVL